MRFKKGLLYILSILFAVVFVLEGRRFLESGLNGIGLIHAMRAYYIFFFFLYVTLGFFLGVLKSGRHFVRKWQPALLSTFTVVIVTELILRLVGMNATYFEKKHNIYNPSNFQPPATSYLTDNFHPSITEEHGEYTFFRTYNSFGLAEKEIPLNKDSGVFRILALGDSFTEGAGAPYDSTWVKLLEIKLDNHYPHLNIEVINAGIIGSDPFFSYVLFKDRLHLYNPDMLLIAVNTTDISDYIFRGGMSRFQGDGSVKYNAPPLWEPLYAYSFISRLFIHNLLGYDYHFLKKEKHLQQAAKGIEELVNVVRLFAETPKAESFKTVVILHPQYGEALKGAYFYEDFASQFIKDAVNVIDVLPFFAKQMMGDKASDNIYYWPVDGHHTPKGYKLFAEGVFREIVSNNYIPNNEAGR